MNKYLQETDILDFSDPSIQHLIGQRGWNSLPRHEALLAVYNFVRDDIRFGYNASDARRASEVLADGYGQCNTKGNLLMALLRAMGVPCRMHGFTIFNDLQRGAIPNYLMRAAPARILHSWVEVEFEEQWLELEGFIIDRSFLRQIQRAHPSCNGKFIGYGIATPCLQKPAIEWQGSNTYIQREGIADDYGVFDDPDSFYQRHGTNLKGLRRLLFTFAIRHVINRHVHAIRRRGLGSRARKHDFQASRHSGS